MRRKRSLTQIYREAARLIDADEMSYSCVAVQEASVPFRNWSINPDVLRYAKVFSPRSLWAFANRVYHAHKTVEGMRQHRVMMLLFMAEAWKDFE